MADGMVFADIGDLPDGSEIAAFDVRDGTEKWRKPLVGQDLAQAERGDFWPLGAQDGVLYVSNEKGLQAFGTKDGAKRDTGCPRRRRPTSSSTARRPRTAPARKSRPPEWARTRPWWRRPTR